MYHRVLKRGWQEGPRQRGDVLMEAEAGVIWGHDPRNVDVSRSWKTRK